MATCHSFADLCELMGLPVRFDEEQLTGWCVFWCEHFKATTLDTHMSAFRVMAREHGWFFPARRSLCMARIADLRRGLAKADRTPTRQAHPVTLGRLRRMFAVVLGVREERDLWLLPLPQLQLMTRMLVAHWCMMRMVGHRDGMLASWESRTQRGARDDTMFLKVYEHKDGRRRGDFRRCGMPCIAGNVSNAGFVLSVYMRRVLDGCAVASGTTGPPLLFPQLVRAAGGGWARSGLPASERVFKAKLREWAGASGKSRGCSVGLRPTACAQGALRTGSRSTRRWRRCSSKADG